MPRTKRKRNCKEYAPSQTNEGTIRKFLGNYYRIANLGNTAHFCATLSLNQWFEIPHTPLYFGWMAFAHIYQKRNKLHPLPSYIDLFVPYFVDAVHPIQNFIRKKSVRTRYLLKPVLERVNLLMRKKVFPDSIYFGEMGEELESHAKHRTQSQLAMATRKGASFVPGRCIQNREHGPYVESLSGMVCQTCGQVGHRILKPHYDTMVAAQAKSETQSLVSQFDLPEGSMETCIRVKDPNGSITRGQFEARCQREFFIPSIRSISELKADTIPCKSKYHMPHNLRMWFLYIFDFIKLHNTDRGKRPERLSLHWVYGIWIYGYLVWITVQQAAAKHENNLELLAKQHSIETTQTSLYQNVLTPRYRYLEACRINNVVLYYKIRGISHRFYPPKLKAPQFLENAANPLQLFADEQTRTLSMLLQTSPPLQKKCTILERSIHALFASKNNANTSACVRKSVISMWRFHVKVLFNFCTWNKRRVAIQCNCGRNRVCMKSIQMQLII